MVEFKQDEGSEKISVESLEVPEFTCRNCRNFVRITDLEEKNQFRRIVDRKGFCLLGREEGGDYTLFRDCSGGCPHYCFDRYNHETYLEEQKLRDMRHRFTSRLDDRRTKEYRCLMSFLEVEHGTLTSGRPPKGTWRGIDEMMWLRRPDDLAEEYIVGIAQDTVQWLWSRRSMPYKEYCKVLGIVRLQLADRYAQCIGPQTEYDA